MEFWADPNIEEADRNQRLFEAVERKRLKISIMRAKKIPPQHMAWELNIHSWEDFAKMVSNLSLLRPDIQGYDDKIDFITFLKFIFPNQPISQWEPIAKAFELVPFNNVVRVPWNPIKHPKSPHDKPTLVCPIPPSWGVVDGTNYFSWYESIQPHRHEEQRHHSKCFYGRNGRVQRISNHLRL